MSDQDSLYATDDDIFECHNHCTWVGTLEDMNDDIYQDGETILRCPLCLGSLNMMVVREPLSEQAMNRLSGPLAICYAMAMATGSILAFLIIAWGEL